MKFSTLPQKEKKEYEVAEGYPIDWNKFDISTKCNKDDLMIIASPSAFLGLLVEISQFNLKKSDPIVINDLTEKKYTSCSKEEKKGNFPNLFKMKIMVPMILLFNKTISST